MLPYAQTLWKLYVACKLFSDSAYILPDLLPHSNGIPALKRLVNNPHSPDELASLITDIFSVHDGAEIVARLRGDDAQSFVDAIDEVFHFFVSDESTH